ncbi:MAG TPA: hypothetical protein VEV81_05200 [Pyrinomonadaceae bacterium]|nr:hypothetical protein [Pyrinomonadaceae bacterium]
MAEEGTLGIGRASSQRDDEEEPSKEELQRRMEEARESITQTVTEIKETVTNQYYSMKETVTDALDWRHHFRRNPIAFSVGALGAGFLLGYGIAGALKNGSREESADYPSYEETDVFARTGATPERYEDEATARHSAFHGHSYAAQPITDSAREDEEARYTRGSAGDVSPVQSSNYAYSAPRLQQESEEEEEDKPGLFQRFKETSAYDRLQSEVSSLGDRFIDELSKTAQTVVLPALFNKIKELFGVDLSGRQAEGGASSSGRQFSSPAPQEANPASAPVQQNAQAAGASASSLASASRGTGSAYATSENLDYGAQSEGQREKRKNEGDSVLDLDR